MKHFERLLIYKLLQEYKVVLLQNLFILFKLNFFFMLIGKNKCLLIVLLCVSLFKNCIINNLVML